MGTFICRKKVFKTETYKTLLNNLLHLLTEFCYLRARHRYYYHELSYKANSESSYCNLRVCDIGVEINFSSYDLIILLIPHLLKLLKFENAIETGVIKIN